MRCDICFSIYCDDWWARSSSIDSSAPGKYRQCLITSDNPEHVVTGSIIVNRRSEGMAHIIDDIVMGFVRYFRRLDVDLRLVKAVIEAKRKLSICMRENE